MLRLLRSVSLLGLSFFLLGCPLSQKSTSAPKEVVTPKMTKTSSTSPTSQDPVTTESGLTYIDQAIGTGDIPQKGQRVSVHYTGRLKDGKKFDSSLDRNRPFEFTLGVGQVIKGWDEGISTMRVGGKRKLIIPPELGYGERGVGALIPPDAELHFDVELLGLN